MPRPCAADHAPSPDTCRLCHWCASPCATGKAYRAAWGEPEPGSDSRRNRTCLRLRDHTGESRQCNSCARSEQEPLYGCDLHGQCSLNKLLPGVPNCRVCGDFVPVPDRELLPGIPDPLPGPRIVRPKGWVNAPQTKLEHVLALRRLKECSLPPPPRGVGEGIVTCGGGRYWPMVHAAVEMALEYDYPVQVWHRGADEPVGPIPAHWRDRVKIRDLTKVPGLRHLGGWEGKTVALLNCGFERALFLDADAYLVGDPAPLFRLAREAGFVSWGDLPMYNEYVGWEWFGMDRKEGQNTPSVQGGQLCVDIARFWRPLVIAHWLNQHSDYVYHHPRTRQAEWHAYGDQDCWRIALALTGHTHCHLGPAPWVHPAFVCRLGETPLVVHRCQGKAYAENYAVTSHLPGDREYWRYFEEGLACRSSPTTASASSRTGS